MVVRRRRTRLKRGLVKSDFVDSVLIDKVSLWILRVIFQLGGSHRFLNKENLFEEEDVAYFLNVEEYLKIERDKINRTELFNILEEQYQKLESSDSLSSCETLNHNITQLSNLMNLNKSEESILEFVILLNQYDILREGMALLPANLNTNKVKRVLAQILDLELKDVEETFHSHSKLVSSSLVTIYKGSNYPLYQKVEIINEAFADNMLHLKEDITMMFKESLRECNRSELNLNDYVHLSSDISIIVSYLKNSLAKKRKGVNILLYGNPGTGKTELVKTLSEVLDSRLFEITYSDSNGNGIEGYNRLKAYKTAQQLLGEKNMLLMYDEAEDVFDSSTQEGRGYQRQENKAWLNRMLENNTIPTIWITNNVHRIDNAMVRRFDFTLEVPIPYKKKREEIIKKYSKNLLDTSTIKELAEHKYIAPALVSRATRVVSSLEEENSVEAFTKILNNTLKAQGYDEIKKQTKKKNPLPILYSTQFVNSSIDLESLTQGIAKHPTARLCIYGVAGTGKSAFGHHLSKALKKPLLLKKGSDLMGMFVGETEKNIANAFKEAKEEDAILLFDEVDSFLTDRRGAKQSWELTQVNEMLVQMENFEGIFIATTNLMDRLDKASLRRFDMKMEFGYLQSMQLKDIFQSYQKELSLAKASVEEIERLTNLPYLTPGDFAMVFRQSRFKPIESVQDFLQRLEEEMALKETSNENKMGFKINL